MTRPSRTWRPIQVSMILFILNKTSSIPTWIVISWSTFLTDWQPIQRLKLQMLTSQTSQPSSITSKTEKETFLGFLWKRLSRSIFTEKTCLKMQKPKQLSGPNMVMAWSQQKPSANIVTMQNFSRNSVLRRIWNAGVRQFKAIPVTPLPLMKCWKPSSQVLVFITGESTWITIRHPWRMVAS